jgi:hypothetical protein
LLAFGVSGETKPHLCSERQAAKSLPADKSAPAGDNVGASTRKDALQAKLPLPVYQQISINSFSHALLIAGSPDNDLLVAAKRLVNLRQGAESQQETAQSNEVRRAKPVAAKPLQQGHSVFTHALLPHLANTLQDMQQTPPYKTCNIRLQMKSFSRTTC